MEPPADSQHARDSQQQTPGARRRTQSERRAQAEAALLSSAAHLFAKNGITATSLGDIGEAAGYSRGLANFYFGSKADLVEQLTRRSLERLSTELDIDGNDHDDETELATLLRVSNTYLSLLWTPSDFSLAFTVLAGSAFPRSSELRPIFAAHGAGFHRSIQALLASGQRNNTINPEIDPDGGAAAFISALRGATFQRITGPEQSALSAIQASYARLIQTSFGPDRGFDPTDDRG